MSNFNPLSSSVSFDDLLKVNKQQFDKIFLAQTQELGVLGSTHRPTTSADLASASLASEAAEQSADVYGVLNERFGSQWSSEVVEHKTERGSVTVLCKLTVNGSSKMQFGSARANGDEGAALRRATEAALRGCAEMFGGVPASEARADQPARRGRRLPARTAAGALLTLARPIIETDRKSPARHGFARSDRECAAQCAPRNGRGAVPLGDVAGNPRTA